MGGTCSMPIRKTGCQRRDSDRRPGPEQAVGAQCCVDIAGSFSRTIWYGPDPRNFTREFFDAAVETPARSSTPCKPERAKFTYEMMGWSLPDSPDSYLEDDPGRGPPRVRRSPRSLQPRSTLARAVLPQHRALNECFDKLGPWIVSCHAKDLTWDVEMNVHFREVPMGEGQLDWRTTTSAGRPARRRSRS